MMYINDYSDSKEKGYCSICLTSIYNKITSNDHIPSKCLLVKPYPNNLPTLRVCAKCNNIISKDEHKFLDFLKIKKTNIENLNSQNLIENEKDKDAFTRVIMKNAMGHLSYEFGSIILTQPATIGLWILNPENFDYFNSVSYNLYPEVGSRMMQRLFSGDDIDNNGWITVQKNVYKYSVFIQNNLKVRAIIWNKFVSEVIWDC